jgi:hypothetical protein
MKRMGKVNRVFLRVARSEGNQMIQILFSLNCRFSGSNSHSVRETAVGDAQCYEG